ncbi:MFS transporter [Streptomyces sp. NPDC054841]
MRVAPWVRRSLPPPGAAGTLVTSAFCGSIGTGLFLAGSMLFFTRGVGLSAVEVSLGLSVAAVCGMLASVPLGGLADRVGPRPMMVILYVWRVVTYGLYVLVHSFPAFLVVVCATTIADRASPAINQAMVGELFSKEERLRTMGYLRAVQNVGLSLGALLATFALSWESRAAYDLLALGNAASYVLMAGLVWRIRPVRGAVSPAVADRRPAKGARRGGMIRPLKEKAFLALSGFSGVLALHDTVLFVGLPLWVAEHTQAPLSLVSIALIVNTVVTAVSQTWWTRLARTLPRAVRGMAVSGAVLALAAVAIGPASHMSAWQASALLLTGVLLLTIGENLHAASAWEVGFELSPPDARTTYLSVFHLGESARDVVGPMLVVSLVVGTGSWGWVGLAVLFLLAGGASRQAARAVARTRSLASAGTTKVADEETKPGELTTRP